jgi:hypothetical protein
VKDEEPAKLVKPVKIVRTNKVSPGEQLAIDDLIELVVTGIKDAGKNWTQVKPGIKAVWLRVSRNYLDRLIAIAEKEEECND